MGVKVYVREKLARARRGLKLFLDRAKKIKNSRNFIEENGYMAFIYELFKRSLLTTSMVKFFTVKNYSEREFWELVYKKVKIENLEKYKVSFVVPVLNGMNDGLPELIVSIKNQTHKNIEIIAVDSGSTDGSIEFMYEQGVKVISIPKKEFRHDYARNLGAENAEGDFIVFTVQDAIFHDEDWVRKAILSVLAFDAVSFSSPQAVKENADIYAIYLAINFIENNRYRVGVNVLGNKKLGKFFWLIASIPIREMLIHIDDTNHLVRRDYFLQRKYALQTCEDMEFGKRVILDNKLWIYSTITSVKHSHRYKDYAKYFVRTFVDNIVINEILYGKRKKEVYNYILDKIILYSLILIYELIRIIGNNFSDNFIITGQPTESIGEHIYYVDFLNSLVNKLFKLDSSLGIIQIGNFKTKLITEPVLKQFIDNIGFNLSFVSFDPKIFNKLRDRLVNYLWSSSHTIFKYIDDVPISEFQNFLIHASINVFSFELAKAFTLYEDNTSINRNILINLKWR